MCAFVVVWLYWVGAECGGIVTELEGGWIPDDG